MLPSWLVGWWLGQNAGLGLFAVLFVLLSLYFFYGSKKDKSDTLTIIFDDNKQELLFLINKDLIRTTKVSHPDQLTAILESECKSLEQVIAELVNQVKLINLHPKHLPEQLGQAKVL